MLNFDVQLIGKYFANGGRMLWTPNLPYRIPAAVLQILPLVANLWGCRWDKFVLFIFHFRLLLTLFVLFECLCLRAKVCWVLYWNKCARHAGSGQCFRPALFWRHRSSRISGLSRHVAVVNLALVCVGYSEDPTPHSHTQGRNAQKQHRQGALAHGDYPSDSAW